jgi:hypothetical protein
MKMRIISKKKNPKMPWIVPIGKPYRERKGRPSRIGNVSRLLTSGWVVPIRNNGGGPFGIRHNGL